MGAPTPCSAVLWAHPPSGARRQENHTANSGDTPPPTWARCTCHSTRPTHTLCCALSVSDCHTAGASHPRSSRDHRPGPPHIHTNYPLYTAHLWPPGLFPTCSSHHLLGPSHKCRRILPTFPLPFLLMPLPSPTNSFISINKRSLNTHRISGSVLGADHWVIGHKEAGRHLCSPAI